ncbi:MAG: putative mycofactocin radical SAM maturase MftC [Chlamydiae bacterium]|nr:putative mycofactocin radical SAM maturase MftC [Chlamydiota bacterium]
MFFQKVGRYVRNVLFISPKLPEHADIEICTKCNLSCKMCKRETIDFGNQIMPYERFCAIVDRLPKGVKVLSFGGYGEMLIHPQFFEMVHYAKAHGFWIQTTSNGTLLVNEKRIRKLLTSGLDEFRISIDHVRSPVDEPEVGHVFSEKLLSILKNVSKLKQATHSSLQLGINTVVHKGNFDEIEEIVQFAEELKLNFIELIRLDTCANKANRTLDLEDERKLYKRLLKRKTPLKINTPLNRFSGVRRLYNLRQQYCPLRLKGIHIRLNGAVTPCAFGFAAHDLGNIFEQDLQTIWSSEPFRKIRANDQNPICKSCSLFSPLKQEQTQKKHSSPLPLISGSS